MKPTLAIPFVLAAVATVTGVATPALAAPTADRSAVSAEQLQGVSGTRLVFRNTTDRTLMLYCPDGGIPDNTREHYMGALSPGQEYTFAGYNTAVRGATDVYVRVYTVKNGTDGASPERDTMVATVGAHNPTMGYPFLRVTAGTYEKLGKRYPYIRQEELSEHETHDAWKAVDGNRFRAWIHRDADVSGDDYKTLKITLQDIDTAPTKDWEGGGGPS